MQTGSGIAIPSPARLNVSFANSPPKRSVTQDHTDLTESNPLLRELKKIVHELSSFPPDVVTLKDIRVQTLYQRCLTRLLYTLEKILEHGIKDVSTFGTGTYFWSYLESLPQCLPGSEAKEVIRVVKATIGGNLGRGRVFLRLSLNEGTVSENLGALMFNVALTNTYYRKTAIVADEDHVAVLLPMLEALKQYKFEFTTDDKDLDDHTYWNKLVRRTDANVVDKSNPLSAPLGLTKLTKSKSLASIETMNNIVEQAQQCERELAKMRAEMLQIKVQLEMEKQEKAKLHQDNKKLRDKIGDLDVELNHYKSFMTEHSSTDKGNTTKPNAATTDHSSNNSDAEQLFRLSIDNPQPSTSNNNAQDLTISNINNGDSNEELNEAEDARFYVEIEMFVLQLQRASACIKEMKDFDTAMREKLLKI